MLEAKLKAELSSEFSTLRVSCDRPRLRYKVHLVATLQEVLTETFEAMIKADTHLDYLEEEKHQPGGRVIVFVSRKADADGLIRVINGQMAYRVHHSDLSATEKEEALAAWRDGTVKFMIATKGFGVGVDYPHVRFVLNYRRIAVPQQTTFRAKPGSRRCNHPDDVPNGKAIRMPLFIQP